MPLTCNHVNSLRWSADQFILQKIADAVRQTAFRGLLRQHLLVGVSPKCSSPASVSHKKKQETLDDYYISALSCDIRCPLTNSKCAIIPRVAKCLFADPLSALAFTSSLFCWNMTSGSTAECPEFAPTQDQDMAGVLISDPLSLPAIIRSVWSH